MNERSLAGVDGCRNGWIIAHTVRGPRDATIEFVSHWRDIHARFDVVAVDMPIGLSDDGVRRCESEARARLRPHGARVFRVPARGALAFAPHDWTSANGWSKRQGFGGISKQSWNIFPKIAEIDGVIAAPDQARIYEAHPELAFARLNDGTALASKHTRAGEDARVRLLKRAGFAGIANWIEKPSAYKAKADDIIDACVLLLTAERIANGTAECLPAEAARDSRGLTMAIWV